MKNKKVFYINLIYYLCILIVAFIFALGYFKVIKSEFLTSALIQGLVMLGIPTLMYSLFVSKSIKKTFVDFGFKKISLTILLCSVGLGFTLFFINGYVADIFYTILTFLGYDSSIGLAMSVGSDFFKDMLLTALIPGICEEVLHRGMYLRGCAKQGYTRYGLIFSSILFGLTHLNIQQFFYASIIGLLMGIIVIITDSILPSIIIHIMNNGLSIYFAYGAAYNWPVANLKAILENAILSLGFVPAVIMLCAIIALLIYLYRLLLVIIIKDKQKLTAQQLAKDLNMQDMSYNEINDKLNEVEQILQQSSTPSSLNIKDTNTKLKYADNVFLYSSIALGILVTVSSFIWGIL